MSDRLLAYYSQELEEIQRLAGEFAAAHPKIAGRLRLSADAIDDPHAGRLIEAFAFIAGRLRLKIDDDFPELTETLLDVLYPHYLAPIPSAAICQFEPTADFSEGLLVPRGTLLESEPIEGDVCRFRTTQAVDLWPIAVHSATLSGRPLLAPPAPRLEAAASLRLVLRCLDPEQTFTRLGVDRLNSLFAPRGGRRLHSTSFCSIARSESHSRTTRKTKLRHFSGRAPSPASASTPRKP